MLNNDEIIRGNKSFAEFLGWDLYNNGVYYTPFEHASYCAGEPTHIVNFPQELKFHKSWDWLMPVVGMVCSSHLYPDFVKENGEIVVDAKNIDGTWLYCVNFVKWHKVR